jgi:cyclohexanone monooxygenase
MWLLPGIPASHVRRAAFHTSRWDYAYTGGDLDGRRWTAWATSVATSAPARPPFSAYRTLHCQGLLVVQRTPSSVDVRANQPIDPRWFAEIATPGWQERWLENFVANMSAAESPSQDLVNDGWTDLAKRIRGRLAAPRSNSASFQDLLADFENADFEKMSEIRARSTRRREPGYRCQAEGLVPAALQATLLPR